MFKRFIISTIILIVSFVFPLNSSAHPGRTNIDGCHTCRTNCERWDLSYGEYHCHGNNIKETVKEVKSTAKIEAKKSAKQESK